VHPRFHLYPHREENQATAGVASANAGHARAASGLVAPFRQVDVIGAFGHFR
jgi:hypothetical protein